MTQWIKEQLPVSVQNKPEHILKAGLIAANTALSKGLTAEEATFACLSTIKRLEKASSPVKAPRKIPEHVQQLLKQQVQEPEIKKNIDRAFLGKNALPITSDRVLVSADFNSSNQLVLTFDTGETLTTKAVVTEENIQQYLSVNTDSLGTNINSPINGQVLVYNSTTNQWENQTISTTEGEDVQAKRTDMVGDTIIYQGEAVVGTLNSASTWRIRLITLAVDGDVSTTWAEGNSNYNKVWNDRLTYTYS